MSTLQASWFVGLGWLRKLDIILTVTALGLATTTYITGEPFLALATPLLIADFYFHYRRAVKQRKILVS